MRKLLLPVSVMVTASAGLLLAGWRGDAQRAKSISQSGGDGHSGTIIGQALPGLTAEQLAAFDNGRRHFSTIETAADGLGVVFNGTSCAECHKAAAIGGAGIDLTISRVSRIGGIRGGAYTDLPELGGPVMQARSLREFDPRCPVPGEIVPREANFVSHRITTPLFGAGLIEAIPDRTILARAGRPDRDGVNGVANRMINPETGLLEVGKFGWKAQHGSLHVFAGDAYLNEMGVSTPAFPVENQPQGRPIPPGWGAPGIEETDDEDLGGFTDFMRYLAPPGRRQPETPMVQNGERLFDAIRCTACHVPAMETGPNAVRALAFKNVPLYSDLLLHRMGPALADGIQQSLAKGDQFRTAPLWGLSRRQFFLHDGRARTPDEAVQMHDGEAAAARARYMKLSPQERQAVQGFLGIL